jgi:hypothetical protein
MTRTTPLELVLTAMEFAAFSAVRDAGIMGIDIERLEGRLYDHMLDPPLTARNCTYVHINHANKKLAAFGLKIVAVNRRYMVLNLAVAPPPRQRVIRQRGRYLWAL